MDHNMDAVEKIRLSAREIVGYKEGAIWSSPIGFIPGPHQIIMGSLLTWLCAALCRIWEVPNNFKKALEQNLVSQEAYSKQFKQFLEKLAGAGNVGPADSMMDIVSLGVMVTGAILYVKAAYDSRRWDANRSEKDYEQLIKEFVDLHGPDLKQTVRESHSIADVLNPETDRDQVNKQLVEYFDRVSAQHRARD